MALQTEVWVNDIKENLFSGDNSFMRMAMNHDAFVNDAVVHIPQAGAVPNVEKNRSVFPATITERADSEKTYNLGSFTVDPIRVRRFDELQTSYQKRQSILRNNINVLNDRMALETMFSWGVSGAGDVANIVRTTGAASSTALSPGATGTRLAITIADIRKCAQIMDKQNIPSMGRKMLLDSDLWYQLLEDPTLTSRDYTQASNIETGMVGQLFGFDIMKRSKTNVYDNAAVPVIKAIGSAPAVTDNLSGIAWHEDSVCQALGGIYPFLNEGVAENYGDIFSAEIEQGSTICRSDKAGVLALIQAA